MKITTIKRLALILTILIISTFSRAQLYGHFGYNMGFPMKMDNLNFVIDRYNETRPYLDRTFDHFKYMDGFTFGLGFSFYHSFFEFGYTTGSQVREAEGTDLSSIHQIRQLKAKGYKLDVGGGYVIRHKNKSVSFIGAQFNIGKFDVLTRTARQEIKKADWSKRLTQLELVKM